MVLPNPSADNDTDEDVGEDGEAVEVDDGDFLADFPDNTEVRLLFRMNLISLSKIIGRVRLGTRVVTLSHWVFGRPTTESILCTLEETLFKAELCFCSRSRNVSSVDQAGRTGFI